MYDMKKLHGTHILWPPLPRPSFFQLSLLRHYLLKVHLVIRKVKHGSTKLETTTLSGSHSGRG